MRRVDMIARWIIAARTFDELHAHSVRLGPEGLLMVIRHPDTGEWTTPALLIKERAHQLDLTLDLGDGAWDREAW